MKDSVCSINGPVVWHHIRIPSLKHGGLNMINAILSFNVAQMRYVPLANVEKMIAKEIEKLKKGEFEVFTLTIKFGVGTGKMPSLGMATQLMSYAGIMAQHKPQELKKELERML